MRFQVPQFIEVEDKIFGPFTFKQFVYLVGGVAGAYLVWRVLPAFIGPIFALPILGLALALAFYKVNNRPFIDVVESAITYFIGNKLYIWKKEDKKIAPKDQAKKGGPGHEDEDDGTDVTKGLFVPKLSESKLKDLSWSLDVNETIYSHESKSLGVGQGMRRGSKNPF
ncbi:MAG: PrgI family protein [Candidatus Pacebacteria bacterium]|nr:PrgI family protein [Candidatus Paceibacterota bacterium]